METVPDMDDLLDQLEASEIINITNHMKDYSIKLASSECDENKKEEIKLNKGKMENGDSPVSFEMDNNASIELNKDHDNCSELSELCISQSINGPGVKDVDACDAQAVPSSIEINASDSNSETSGLDSNRSSTIDAYASECANINVENSISSVCDNWNDNKSVAEAPDAQEKSSAPETDFLLMKKTKSSSLSLHRRSGESSTVHEESVAMEGCLSNRTLGGRKTESKSTADAQNDGPTGGVIEVDLNQERGIAEEVDLGSAELAGQDTETKRELGLEEPVLGHISANVSNKSTVNDDCPEKRDARVFVDEVVSIGREVVSEVVTASSDRTVESSDILSESEANCSPVDRLDEEGSLGNSEAQSDERSGRATGALVVGSAGDYASEDVETVASHGAPSSATNHMENCTVINDEGIPSDEAGSDVHESPSKVVEAESNLESEAGFENRNVEVSQFDSKLRSDDGQPESGEVDHEGEEVLEDSHLSSDESASPDVTTHPSVVEGVYDISVESDIKRLTESELQLGKVKPVWIADSETTLCMLCCAKFTVLMRRHHCRSCGRVLCAHCTDKKAALPYMNQPTKKFRVCDPCFTTLGLIDEVEKSPSAASKRGEDQSGVDDQVNGNPSAVEVRRKKSVLKQTATSSANQSDLTLAEGQDDALLLENERRSVKFLDGVNPGQDSNPSSPSASSSTPPAVDSSCVLPSLKSKKKSSSKRTHVWRRLKELRIEKECVCLLPDNVETLPYTKLPDGRIDKYHSSEDITKQLKDRNPVVIALSRDLYCTVKICELECCSLGNVWCFCTSGMNGVGLDELLLVYDWQESDDFNLPMDILHRLYDIYDGALQPQDESTDEKMGIRMAENRIPYINYLNHESPNGSFAQRDILLFRPTIQCFDNLIVPESPFLVCCFLHPSESVWARAIPQRLLYRIGLQASYYPTPIVNQRTRMPVYQPIFDTTVLKVFIDFKNWSYKLPHVYGSVMTLENNTSRLIIPKSARNTVRSIVDANRNMVSWSLDFSQDADSHLVCEQSSDGSYKTRVFTNGTSRRKVTGVSFVIFDGGLKSGDSTLNVSVVEDGIVVRIRPDTMISLADSLLAGEDFLIESDVMRLTVEWNEPVSRGYPGELISPVDNSLLLDCYQYGINAARVLTSFYPILGMEDWALRLVSVYNMAGGKFPVQIQSKVFAVSEQVTAQCAYTISPFLESLVNSNIWYLYIRIRITTDDAEYKVAPWKDLEDQHAAWVEVLDSQLAPGLFNLCTYITIGFHAEISMSIISTQALVSS